MQTRVCSGDRAGSAPFAEMCRFVRIPSFAGVLSVLILAILSPVAQGATVFAMGYNSYGQLGLNDTADRISPTIVEFGLSSVNVVAVSGQVHSLMLASDGSVYVAGNNYDGGLGLGDNVDRITPTIMQFGLSSVSIVAVSGGAYHSLMLASDGIVWASGQNMYGQLGLNDTIDRWTPALMQFELLSTSISAISAGYYHSLMLGSDGAVWASGQNFCGQLGLGDNADRYTATKIGLGLSSVSVVAVAGGQAHSLMLASDGSVFGVGYNGNGELGLDDNINRNTPTRMDFGLSPVKIVAISGGYYHSLMLASDGIVWGSGFNGNGQLGLNDTTQRHVPTPMKFGLSSVSVTAVSAGGYHSLMLGSDGVVFATGGVHGGLGINETSQRNTATLLEHGLSLVKVISVAAGQYDSLLLGESRIDSGVDAA